MNCACHDLPAYWQRDVRCRAGGWWECAVRRRADWHKADGGYVQKRRRNLRAQRQQIVQELQQLEQEAARC